MSYTVNYGVDLKAIWPMYPDSENSKPVLDRVLEQVKNVYTDLRYSMLRQREHERVQNQTHNLPVDHIPTASIGEYDEVVTASYATTQGTSYNGVVTMDAVITLVTDDPEAVKLLNKIDIIGTFAIEPSFRISQY